MLTRTNSTKIEAPPKYEAFMMTGERVIKMSKNTQVIFILQYYFFHIIMTIIRFRYLYYLKEIEKLIVW